MQKTQNTRPFLFPLNWDYYLNILNKPMIRKPNSKLNWYTSVTSPPTWKFPLNSCCSLLCYPDKPCTLSLTLLVRRKLLPFGVSLLTTLVTFWAGTMPESAWVWAGVDKTGFCIGVCFRFYVVTRYQWLLLWLIFIFPSLFFLSIDTCHGYLHVISSHFHQR